MKSSIYIEFTFTSFVDKDGEPEEYVDHIKGKIYNYNNHIGDLELRHFNPSDYEYGLIDLLDGVSSDTAYFTECFNDYGPNKDIINLLDLDKHDFSFGGFDFLTFDRMLIKKQHRGNNFGKSIIMETLRKNIRVHTRLCFLKAFPLQYEAKQGNIEDKNKKSKKEFNVDNFEDAQKKLISFYKNCGFKLIPNTKDLMVLDLWNLE